jgi:hypothetical protein
MSARMKLFWRSKETTSRYSMACGITCRQVKPCSLGAAIDLRGLFEVGPSQV